MKFGKYLHFDCVYSMFRTNINTLNEQSLENSFNGPPATGGPRAPLGLEIKLPKNGISEAPQTSQVPRTSLWTNFGEKNFWSYDPPRTPWPLKKGGHFPKMAIFAFFDILCCFSINKMVFLARNVGFGLFLVLETLEQPKISCLKPKFSQVAQHVFRAFNLSLQNFRCYS